MDADGVPVMKPQATNDGAAAAATLTPCVGLCRLDDHGLCLGCRRSLTEIGAWRDLSDAERLRFMRDVLPARKSR